MPRIAFFSKMTLKGQKAVTFLLFFAVLIFMLIMVFIIGNSTLEKQILLMTTDSERAFNSIYMVLNENRASARSVMDEENVTGIGIYRSNGNLYQSIGIVPMYINIQAFEESDVSGGDILSGLYSFDPETKVLEYMRYARLSIDIDAGNLVLNLGEDGTIPGRALVNPSLNFPEILYVAMDGTEFGNSLFRTRMMTYAAAIVVVILFILFVRLYSSNARYRETLTKQESLVSLGAAARTLTHEIKNPLSAMTIQLALMKKMLPEQYEGETELLGQEIDRLVQLTNKISDFLKNPVGQPSLIEVRSFLSDLFPLFSCPITFTAETVSEAYIEFDRDRARSVFENLLKNATESCTGRDPQVSVCILQTKENVEVYILDRGDGLPKNSKGSIFDPFYTTKINGSGIGLSITRQFLKARDGSVTLNAREGGGTVAEVRIPCVSLRLAHAMLNVSSDENPEFKEVLV